MNHSRIDDDDMALISRLYPGSYTQMNSQGETKPKRRRNKKKGVANGSVGARKRKLSAEQAKLLELHFGNEHKLESERKDRLASELGLDPRQVAVWFQNRRARWKNKKLEEEYSNLKKLHETTIIENCHLQNEVLKLKEKLLEAEKENQRLLESGSSSPTSSQTQSIGAMDPPFLGEFGEAYDYDYDMFSMPETHYINGMEWINLYV
ncbi:hypothetical protein L6164_027742 [Bauhinia variegata]|uniref:Uncharacterized protein n=1 Tax=Bauhinia variegata TaxID=167791 RepID=A0ACB9LV10_BAUVA|nr:hypothetical protein L6164_027742 [Bauhinia variegata]